MFGLAMRAHGMLAGVAGLISSASSGAGLTLHLVISVLVGAGFGAIFRYQRHGYMAPVSALDTIYLKPVTARGGSRGHRWRPRGWRGARIKC